MFSSEPDHFSEKLIKLLVHIQPCPVQPGDLIILTIGIIVAKTGVSKFISRKKHGCPTAAHQSHAGIFHHSETEFTDLRIHGLSFHSTVPASVIICSIRIVPSIGFIMLSIIRIQIPERKAIMTGEEINGRIISFILTGIQVQGTGKSVCCCLDKPVVTFQKASHVIPVFPIPLCPAGISRKTPT